MKSVTERKIIQQGFMDRMRCGFCLPSCPTYIESGFQELQSPRGRIALMKAVKEGLLEPDEDVERSLSLCLGCRACEPVCPSGVKYGHLLEEARDIIQQNKKQKASVKTIRNAVFEGLFPHQNRMRTVTSLLGIYQRSGLQKVTRKIGFMKLFPESLATMEKVLPKVPKRKEMNIRPEFLPAEQKRLKRVAFFCRLFNGYNVFRNK